MNGPAGHDAATNPVAGGGGSDDNDEAFLKDMRGWLMTVATLFIGITFHAALSPPVWMPELWFDKLLGKNGNKVATGSSTTPADMNHDEVASDKDLAVRAFLYVFFNTLTFASATGLMVTLLLMKRSPASHTIRIASIMLTFIAVIGAIVFAAGASDDLNVTWLVVGVIVVYSFCAGVLLLVSSSILSYRRSLASAAPPS